MFGISKISCPRDCHGEEDDRIIFSGRAQPRGSVSEIPRFQELNSLVLFNLRGYSGGPTLVEGAGKGVSTPPRAIYDHICGQFNQV